MNMRRVAFLCGLMLSVAAGYAATDLPPVAGMGPGADMSEPPSIDELSAGQEYASATPYSAPVDDSVSSSQSDASSTPYQPVSSSVDTEPTPDPMPQESTPPISPVSGVSISSPDPKIQEVSPEPLFAKKDQASAVMGRKEMVADTQEDERQVREVIKRIDDLKSSQLNEYLSLDAELDKHYEQAGLARGKVGDDIQDIKHTILHTLTSLKNRDASDAEQEKIAQREKMLDELEEQVKSLEAKEAEVVGVLKELSDKAVVAFDRASDMYTGRLEIRGIIDNTAAQNMYEKIKGTLETVKKIESEINGPGGSVSRFEKGVVDARAQVSKVQEQIAALKAMDIDVKSHALQQDTRKASSNAQMEQTTPDQMPEQDALDAEPAQKRIRRKKESISDDTVDQGNLS